MRRLNWLNIFLVLFLLASGVVIFFAFRNGPEDVKPKQASQSKQQASSSNSSKDTSAAPAPKPSTAAPKTQPNPIQASPSTPATTPNQQNPKLTNSGPGDVLGLALLVSVAGTASRYAVLIRRQAS